jgi:uncharacterized RDD family membrane protein YckC
MAWPVGHHDRVSQPQDFPAGQQPGEAAGQQVPSFGGGDQSPSGYGTPGQSQPGYGTPGQSPPGNAAPGGQAYPSYPQGGYGTPGQNPPGNAAPGGQAYPSYPQGGYGSGSPQAGYGQPYHPGYGQYQGYGQQYQGYGQQYQAYGRQYQAYGPEMGRKNPALAEWWRRLLARIIDGFILGVIFAPLWIPPWSSFFRTVQNIDNRYPSGSVAASKALGTADVHFASKLFVILLGFYLVAFVYDWIQHWQWGQTIGKRALGTRVVRDDGNPHLSAGAAGGRAAIYAFAPLIPLAGSLFELLNELWLTWDPRRQCLHDKAAHTVVVKKDYQGPQPQPGGWQPGGW